MIETRSAVHADVTFIAHCQVAMAHETEALDLDLDTVCAGVRAVVEHPERGVYLVAHRGLERAGCVLLLKEWSDWRNREVWWLHSVYVEPSERGSGVFRALFGEAEVRARAAGAAGLRLYVDVRNVRAQQVYRQLGMSDEHYALFERMF